MKEESVLDRPERIQTVDSRGMARLLRDFAKQVDEAVQIGEDFGAPTALRGTVEQIVFVGMGGSAIGGDVIRSSASDSRIPIVVSRHYELPTFVSSKSLCIFSSYSGNTEETLSAFRQGVKAKVKAVAISSGGELAQAAKRSSVPWIQIPKGVPPRAALGYSVFPLLRCLGNLKLVKWDAAGIEEMSSLLREMASQWAPERALVSNPTKQLAQALCNRWIAIYAGTELLDSAALRFRNQIEENAKTMASHHLLPEMNHNEILGWQFPKEALSRAACVFLRDAKDHPRIQLRMRLTQEVIREKQSSIPIEEIHSQGKSRLARIFSVIYFGDWTSFYLALLYEIDPTPVTLIEWLKKELARGT